MNNSNSYTFSEIVLALRGEYVKNEKLLKELEKCLFVDGNAEIEARICPSYSRRDVNNILIDIYEKQSNIRKAINRIKFDVFDIAIPIEPYRVVKKEFGKYVLKFEDYLFQYRECEKASKYSIGILNEQVFNDVIEEIVNSDFMKLPDFGDSLNPFQFLNLKSDDVSLSGSFSQIKPNTFPSVSYNTKNDTICALPSNGGVQIINDFLNTRIPKDFIPEEYRKIIERAVRHSKGKVLEGLDIVSPIKKGCELDIVEKPNNYALVKRRDYKFYDYN